MSAVNKFYRIQKLLKMLVIVAQSCICSLGPHGLWPTRLLCPWDSPGQSTGAGSHFLLQGIFPTQGSNLRLLHCMQILYHLICNCVYFCGERIHSFINIQIGTRPKRESFSQRKAKRNAIPSQGLRRSALSEW